MQARIFPHSDIISQSNPPNTIFTIPPEPGNIPKQPSHQKPIKTMKAITYHEYGPPSVLKLTECDIPTPRDNEVRVKLHATALNASDWEILRGKPLYARIFGLFKPKFAILGTDIAGQVEAVGEKVTRFKPGDAVFGDIFEIFGGFAEYVCVPETNLTIKPPALTFTQAAALPQSVCIALQGIRDKGQVQPGQKVLINGGGGGAGTFAIQLAKHFGAEVTGVDNTEKQQIMRQAGADFVIDYTQVDFTKNAQQYDLVFDMAAHHTVMDYRRVLRPRGKYLMVGGSMKAVLAVLLVGSLTSLFSGKKMRMLALKLNQDLNFILELCKTGKLVPMIDRIYPLSQTPEALRYLGEGHAKGKVVISMEDEPGIEAPSP